MGPSDRNGVALGRGVMHERFADPARWVMEDLHI
jgi:hypothetical protein